MSRQRRTLVVRLDSMGDVLVSGPAIRALAATSDHLTLLAGPLGEAAARLLPGVDEVLTWCAPWVDADPEPVRPDAVAQLTSMVSAGGYDRAVILTSFHQSALPTALLLRLAGVPWIAAFSEDYPGSLLDVRVPPPGDIPEPERALLLAAACHAGLPAGDDGRLAVLGERGAAARFRLPDERYVVLHPGTSVPARAWPAERFRELCAALLARGRDVVVTGAAAEGELAENVVADSGARNLAGRTTIGELAGVLAGAQAVVVGNTGPAHLAAAVGTPVVSLFAPTVPAARWAPYGVPSVLLGDQLGPCRATRAKTCPVPGHPCLTSVTVEDVLAALAALASLGSAVTPTSGRETHRVAPSTRRTA